MIEEYILLGTIGRTNISSKIFDLFLVKLNGECAISKNWIFHINSIIELVFYILLRVVIYFGSSV